MRDVVCLAGPGDMCVEPSPSGSQISKTSGINLPGGKWMPSDVSPLLENRQKSYLCIFAFSTRLLILLFFFFASFAFFFFFWLRQPSCPQQLDLTFQLFINEFCLILWCLIPLPKTLLCFLEKPVEAGMCLRGLDSPPSSKIFTRKSQLVSRLSQDRVTRHSGQMMAKMHNLMKAKCQAQE